MIHNNRVSQLLTLFCLLIFTTAVNAQNGQQRIDWPHYQDMAVDLLQKYLRINTSNPPGNESEAAKWFKSIFDQNGIQNEIFEYKPSRANIIARLKGTGSKRPIILLSHMISPTSAREMSPSPSTTSTSPARSMCTERSKFC